MEDIPITFNESFLNTLEQLGKAQGSAYYEHLKTKMWKPVEPVSEKIDVKHLSKEEFIELEHKAIMDEWERLINT